MSKRCDPALYCSCHEAKLTEDEVSTSRSRIYVRSEARYMDHVVLRAALSDFATAAAVTSTGSRLSQR